MAAKDLALQLLIKAKDQASGVVKKFGRGLDRSLGKARKSGQALAAMFFNLKTAIAAAAGSLGLFRAGDAIISAGADIESLQTRVRSATDTAAEYAAAWGVIEELGHDDRIPLTLQQVGDAFVRLRNLGLEPTREAIVSYGNTAAAMGKSLQDMIEAVADASTMEFERLKEFGIKANAQGDRIKFTFRGVTTEIEKDAKAIEGYLLNIGNTDFAGQMEAQADTLKGIWAGIRKTYDEALALLAGGGLFDVVKEKLKDIQTLFQYLVQSGEAKKWGEGIGEAVSNIGSYIETAAKFIQGFVGGVRVVLNGFTAGVKTLGLAASAFYATMVEGAEKVLRFFGKTEWADKAKEIAGGLRAVQEEFRKGIEEDSAAMDSAFGQIDRAFSNTRSEFGTLMDTAREWKRSTQDDVTKPAADAADALDKEADALDAVGESAGKAAKSLDALNRVEGYTVAAAMELDQAYRDGLINLEQYTEGTKALTDAFLRERDSASESEAAIRRKTAAIEEGTRATEAATGAVSVFADAESRSVRGGGTRDFEQIYAEYGTDSGALRGAFRGLRPEARADLLRRYAEWLREAHPELFNADPFGGGPGPITDRPGFAPPAPPSAVPPGATPPGAAPVPAQEPPYLLALRDTLKSIDGHLAQPPEPVIVEMDREALGRIVEEHGNRLKALSR